MAQLFVVNPRRRRRKARRHVARARHRNTRRRAHSRRRYRVRLANPRRGYRMHRRYRRRNPRTDSLTDGVLMPGLLGAAGGIGLQLVWNSFGTSLLPCSISGNQILSVAAQGAGAVGLGWLAGKALGEKKGDAVAAGALTIVLYNYLNGMIASTPALAGLRGARLGAFLPGQGLNPRRAPGRVALGAFLPGQGLRPRMHTHVTLGAYRPMNPAAFLRGGLRGSPYATGRGMFRR